MSRFVENGKRLMKCQDLMKDVEITIEDKRERSHVLEGFLGYVLSNTQVILKLFLSTVSSLKEDGF